MTNKYFMTDAEYRRQLVKELIDIVKELGWDMAVPDIDDHEEVPGLIIGEKTYVDYVVECVAVVEDGENGNV
jgi:hypothetical protein